MHPTGLTCVWLIVVALVAPGTAAASSACGLAVLNDWFDDGHVGRLYDLPCYDEAIEAIPADLRDYTNAEEVISRALQAATRGALASWAVEAPRQRTRVHGASLQGADDGQPATAIEPVRASSAPIPVIVLGGMSLVLLAAGGFGYVSRRRDDEHDSSQDGRR